MKKIMVLSLVVFLLQGCASSPRTKRVEALQKLQDDVEKLKQTKADKADANVQWDDLKTEVSVLSGKLEETTHSFKEVEKKLSENNERLDRLIADYDEKIKSLENKVEELDSGQRSGNVQGEQTNVKYDFINGMKYFKAKDYSRAMNLFDRYTRNFPSGRAIENARFYLAETYFYKKDYETAILKYEDYKEKHPRGDKAAESIFKQGMAFVELRKPSDAKHFFSGLIDDFPKSPFAQKAKTELDKLKR